VTGVQTCALPDLCMVLGNDSSRKTAFRFGVALIARHSSSVGPVSPEKAMAPNFPSMMYPTEYTGWCTGMARIFRPWHVTGLWIGITSNERTGFSLVGITRKSGHTRLLK